MLEKMVVLKRRDVLLEKSDDVVEKKYVYVSRNGMEKKRCILCRYVLCVCVGKNGVKSM